MKTRRAALAGAVAATVPLSIVGAPSAVAGSNLTNREDIEPLGLFQVILIYVGIPLAIFALLALLVYAGSIARGPRYRPDLGWWAAPVWFEGPPQGVAALASTPAEQLTTDGGGASARW